MELFCVEVVVNLNWLRGEAAEDADELLYGLFFRLRPLIFLFLCQVLVTTILAIPRIRYYGSFHNQLLTRRRLRV